MRRVVFAISFVLATAATAPGSAEEQEERGNSSTRSSNETTQEDESGAEESSTKGSNDSSSESGASGDEDTPQSESESAALGPFFEPPSPYTFGAELSSGVLFWDTPHGGRESEFTIMGSGHGRLFGPLLASLTVGYSRNAPTAGPLVAANDHVAALAGVGAEGWLNTLRLELQGQAGVLYRKLTLSGGGETTFNDTRFTPIFGGTFSLGTSFFDRLLVSLVSGLRFYAPKRSEFFAGIEAGWLFVHSR